jgi:hypothetical protein
VNINYFDHYILGKEDWIENALLLSSTCKTTNYITHFSPWNKAKKEKNGWVFLEFCTIRFRFNPPSL